MSHDIEASYAATEIVASLLASPKSCFSAPPASGRLSGYAAREGRHTWPHADGVVELAVVTGATTKNYSIAVEFKRNNEGLHGVLTALGQSHSYLHKGYSGSIIVIPNNYVGFGDPGPYVRDVLDKTSQSQAIGVYTYGKPNFAAVSPFAGKLQLQRSLMVDAAKGVIAPLALSRTKTQWAHIREGSTEPDALFKYLQSIKLLSGGGAVPIKPKISTPMAEAAVKNRHDLTPEKYLSNCANDSIADKAWRHFWFKYVLHPDAIEGWSQSASSKSYMTNDTKSQITRSDGSGFKTFFVGRSDSIKNIIVEKLNSKTIGIGEAYKELTKKYFDRAHSYREDIDSGCEHLGFVNSDGRLTDSGYSFVDACERYGNPNEGLPRAIFLKALLGEGSLGAFIHYIHRLSEERFKKDPLAFTKASRLKNTAPAFLNAPYLDWLETEMTDRLHVIRKVSLRGGTARKPFQAELAVLRSMGIVGEFRLGVGLTVNWPELQEAMTFSTFSN